MWVGERIDGQTCSRKDSCWVFFYVRKVAIKAKNTQQVAFNFDGINLISLSWLRTDRRMGRQIPAGSWVSCLLI